jgi:hypothetical protein
MFVISKKKARTLGKNTIGYPIDLEIYGKSIAKPMDFPSQKIRKCCLRKKITFQNYSNRISSITDIYGRIHKTVTSRNKQ